MTLKEDAARAKHLARMSVKALEGEDVAERLDTLGDEVSIREVRNRRSEIGGVVMYKVTMKVRVDGALISMTGYGQTRHEATVHAIERARGMWELGGTVDEKLLPF